MEKTSRKNILVIIVAVVVIIVVFVLVRSNGNTYAPGEEVKDQTTQASAKNATYSVDGETVTLVNGVSEVPAAPGSASKVTTTYFGNEVRHDLDGDGREDVAFLITRNTGGSGTFYYVVAALNKVGGYVGSEAFLLGDRIAPQTTEMGQGNIIIANYADRKPGESFTVSPSVGKSVWLLLDPKTMQFGIVEQNFSGEANPSSMSLSMKEWNWLSTEQNGGVKVVPKKAGIFKVTFAKDGKFSAKTDCNGVSGTYTTNKDSLSFGNMISTLMYCADSQQEAFTASLGTVVKYHFTTKGELILELKSGSGTMTFQ